MGAMTNYQEGKVIKGAFGDAHNADAPAVHQRAGFGRLGRVPAEARRSSVGTDVRRAVVRPDQRRWAA